MNMDLTVARLFTMYEVGEWTKVPNIFFKHQCEDSEIINEVIIMEMPHPFFFNRDIKIYASRIMFEDGDVWQSSTRSFMWSDDNDKREYMKGQMVEYMSKLNKI